MVRGTKGTGKRCGSSRDGVTGTKGTGKRCGNRDSGYWQTVWFFC